MTTIDILRASQSRARRRLLDPKAIDERRKIGEERDIDGAWRQWIFSERPAEAPFVDRRRR